MTIVYRSFLDENHVYLTTIDSTIQVAKSPIQKDALNWVGVLYKVGFPICKLHGANFYPREIEQRG